MVPSPVLGPRSASNQLFKKQQQQKQQQVQQQQQQRQQQQQQQQQQRVERGVTFQWQEFRPRNLEPKSGIKSLQRVLEVEKIKPKNLK